MAFDRAFTDGWMRRFADSVLATEDELTELDQEAGDGDFGTNLSLGLRSAVRALDRLPGGDTAASLPLASVATTFLDEVGGTSGPLFGLLLHEIAAACAAAGPELTAAALAAGTRRGLATVRRVGEAAPGDKTLVDALAPAADALREACGARPAAPPEQALAAAAAAAWDGVRATARLRARRGRASYLGDRVVGVPDPGAVGIGLLFTSAKRTVTALTPFLADGGERCRPPERSAAHHPPHLADPGPPERPSWPSVLPERTARPADSESGPLPT